MNCPECQDELMAGAYSCKCGWKGIPPRQFAPREPWKPYDANQPDIKAARERCMANLARFAIKTPSRDWAHDLVARHEAGEILTPIQISKAYRAVGKPVEDMK